MREAFKKLIEKNGLRIIKCPSGKKDVPDHYYAIDEKDLIGEGHFGRVCKAYLVDPKTGRNFVTEKHKDPKTGKLLRKPYAVKIFKEAKKFDKNEAELLGNYIWVEKPVHENKEVFLFSEYITGENLSEEKDFTIELNESVKGMTFSQRINLINTIILSVNLIHHNTPSSGGALQHADLKGSNIRISADKSGNRVDTTVLDYGLAEKVNDDSSQIGYSEPRGMAKFSPIEVVSGRRGLKSDVYALVPIIVTILGAVDVLKNKRKQTEYSDADKANIIPQDKETAFYKAPYALDGIFEGFEIAKYPVNVKKYCCDFLMKMQENDYRERCDSDEVLRFFTTLNRYCKTYDAKSSDYDTGDYNVFEAKLAVLAAGLWHKKIPTKEKREVEFLSNKEIKKTSEVVSFEQYSFDDNPEICKKIIELSKKNQLDYASAAKLFPENPLHKLANGIEKENKAMSAKKLNDHKVSANGYIGENNENKVPSVTSMKGVDGHQAVADGYIEDELSDGESLSELSRDESSPLISDAVSPRREPKKN